MLCDSAQVDPHNPPPDGFYWYTTNDKPDDVYIVKVYRSLDVPYVLFHGTDIEQEWHDLSGSFKAVE